MVLIQRLNYLLLMEKREKKYGNLTLMTKLPLDGELIEVLYIGMTIKMEELYIPQENIYMQLMQ